MMKKTMLCFLLLGIVLLSGCAQKVSKEDIPAERYCETDSDCIKVSADCCGCSMGGKAAVINKDYQDLWDKNLSGSCKGVVCLAVISKDWTCSANPRCIENKCELR